MLVDVNSKMMPARCHVQPQQHRGGCWQSLQVPIRTGLTVVAMLLSGGSIAQSQTSPLTDKQTAEREFSLKVLPLLKSKCFGCHGNDPDDIQGDFDVRSRQAVLKGGESEEPAIVPGNPDESPFLSAVKWEDLEMPPKENDRLSPEQILLVERWILAGAPWPDESTREKYRIAERSDRSNADGILMEHSGGLSDEWTYRRYDPAEVWAFQPLKQFEPHEIQFGSQNPIDFFTAETLKQAGIERAPQADPQTLIRRASFDLIGLPPSPQQVQQFLSEWETDPKAAWSELIDRLLASPHYGERWGQHWLDVARYADTGGYSNDFERSNAWRYRDYVIRSLNNDKPYDEFLIEQLAGDELADALVRKRLGHDEAKLNEARRNGAYTPEEAELIIATSFLRMGPWDNAMVETAEARHMYLDDVVNAVGQTFLSTTMRCFKCHDHKFDPLPTRDYYRMYAVFAGTQMAERPVPFLDQENVDGFDESREITEQMLAFAEQNKDALEEKRETAAKQWFQEHGLEYKNLKQRENLEDEVKPPRDIGLNHVEEGKLKVRQQDQWIWNRRLERYQPMAQSVFNAAQTKLEWNGARKLRIYETDDPDALPISNILLGGAVEAPGDPVGPGVISALGLRTDPTKPDHADDYLLNETLEGRRLGLAKWIADPKNALATRSIVNRVWQYHFVEALARNPNNFGVKGKKPTHPDLLDWLAVDFVSNGWKLKRLHRMLMLSKTYRMSASHPDNQSLAMKDPENRFLAFFPTRRLSAEEIRDSMLAVTGELNTHGGGLPARPEINMEVALQPRMIQFSLAPAYQPQPTPEQRNRRSIYAYRVRGQPDPFLEIFNQPNPNESCEFRDSASVSPQAFTLLNSAVVTDRSIAFAIRLESESQELEKQIESAFRLVLGRRPDAAELQRLTVYVNEMREYHRGVTPQPPKYPSRITRSLVEEFSGKPFSYEEILPVFENYQPDRKASDVDANTRALADFCVLLFNSNEFIYVN